MSLNPFKRPRLLDKQEAEEQRLELLRENEEKKELKEAKIIKKRARKTN